MKMPKFLILILLAGLLLAACAPASPTLPTPTPIPPTPVETGIPVPSAALAAQKALAERLGVDASAVTIQEIVQVQWPNTCLGIQQPDEACGEMIVDGFRVSVESGGQVSIFHTNFDGSQIREVQVDAAGRPTMERPEFEQTPVGKPVEGEKPAAVDNAVEMLATENAVRPDDINIVSVEEVVWSNSCLGVQTPGLMCMQVLTPGYRIVLETGGKRYEYHTDDAGGKIVEAGSPRPNTLDPAVIWEQTENGICTRAEIGYQFVQYGPCGGTMKQVELSEARAKELAELADVYSSFEAGTRAGVLTFIGNGTREPSALEQRAVAEWARSLRQSVAEGETDVEPAISWTREGGIAGFCDEMSISASGWVYANSCKSASKEPTVYRLNIEQLEMLYDWIDTYSAFTLEQADPAGVADGMSVQLMFNGEGQQQAPRAEQEAMIALMTELFAVR